MQSFGNSVWAMSDAKRKAYQQCKERIFALCEGETDEIAKMASVSCVLGHEMAGFFWTGFYRMVQGELVVGPYQGTVGCLRIQVGRGVCGAAAETGETQVVPNVHEFPGHIACDARSQSEIVVPVTNVAGELIAVLDIDSEELGNFDEVDREELEEIVNRVFSV